MFINSDNNIKLNKHYFEEIRGDISFSRNSEASASEFLENTEKNVSSVGHVSIFTPAVCIDN